MWNKLKTNITKLIKNILHGIEVFFYNNATLILVLVFCVAVGGSEYIYLTKVKPQKPITIGEADSYINKIIYNYSNNLNGINLSKTTLDSITTQVNQYLQSNSNFNLYHCWGASYPVTYDLTYNEPITKDNLKQVKTEATDIFEDIESIWNKAALEGEKEVIQKEIENYYYQDIVSGKMSQEVLNETILKAQNMIQPPHVELRILIEDSSDPEAVVYCLENFEYELQYDYSLENY